MMLILLLFYIYHIVCDNCTHSAINDCNSCVKNTGCGWFSSTENFPSSPLDFKCVQGDSYSPKNMSMAETYLYYSLHCPELPGPEPAIHKRRSIRKYDTTQISKGILELIIGDAVWAPNCLGYEPLRWYVVQDKKLLDEISKHAHMGENIFHDAPTVVFLFTKPGVLCIPFQDIDGGVATEAFEISAYNLGLGTCTIGESRLAEGKIREVVGASIEEHYVIAIVIGHGLENPTHDRKPPIIKFV